MKPWEKYQAADGPWVKYAPKPKDTPAPAAVDEMGGLERFLAGIGGGLYDPYLGIKQALGMASQSEVDENARLSKPLTDTPAGMAGKFVGAMAPALAAPVATIPGAIALGAAQGAAQPVESGQSRGLNAAIGGVGGGIGQGVARGIGALMRGPKNVLTPAEQALSREAEKAGVALTPAQKTGNKFLKNVDAVLEQLPATAGKAADRQAFQAQQFTRAVTNTFGSSADDIGEGTMKGAKQRIGDTYQRIFAGEKIDAASFAPRLGLVKAEAVRALPEDKARVVANKIDDIFNKVDEGAIDGLQYQKWRSSLNSSDGDTKHYLKLARAAVDDAASVSLSPGKMEEFLKANIQYKNLKTVQPLAEKSVSGFASPGLLLERVRAANPDMAFSGAGDLGRLAKVGKAFVKEQVPNSGTAQRMMAQTLLTGGVGGGTLAFTGDPEAALKAGAGTMASTVLAPKLMQGLLSSNAMQRYLTGGARVNPAIEELIRRGAVGAPIAGLLQ